jgi:hypothetical protein
MKNTKVFRGHLPPFLPYTGFILLLHSYSEEMVMITFQFWVLILRILGKYAVYLFMGYLFLNLMCIGWDMEGTYYDDTEDVELYKDLNNIEEVYYLSQNKTQSIGGTNYDR